MATKFTTLRSKNLTECANLHTAFGIYGCLSKHLGLQPCAAHACIIDATSRPWWPNKCYSLCLAVMLSLSSRGHWRVDANRHVMDTLKCLEQEEKERKILEVQDIHFVR